MIISIKLIFNANYMFQTIIHTVVRVIYPMTFIHIFGEM